MLLLFLVFLFRLGRDDVCDGWMYCCGLLAAGRLLLGIAQWCKGGSLSYHGAFTTHGRHARVGCVGYTAGDQQLSSKGRFSCHRCLRPSPSVTFRALRERGAVRFHGPDANGFAGDQRTAQIRRSVEKSFRSQFPSFFFLIQYLPNTFSNISRICFPIGRFQFHRLSVLKICRSCLEAQWPPDKPQSLHPFTVCSAPPYFSISQVDLAFVVAKEHQYTVYINIWIMWHIEYGNPSNKTRNSMKFIYKCHVFRVFSFGPRPRSGILRWMPCCFPAPTRSRTRATAPCWRTCGRASASVALWRVPIGPCPDSRWSQETMGTIPGKNPWENEGTDGLKICGKFDDWKNLGGF